MTKIHLSREEFAAFFIQLLKECYPDEVTRDRMRYASDSKLFGINSKGGKEKTIISIIFKKYKISLGERPLRDLVANYDNKKKIEITARKFTDFMRVINLTPKREYLKKLAEEFVQKNPSFPPEKLRINANVNTTTSRIEHQVTHTNHLFEMSQNQWWFYFYEYEGSTVQNRKVIRLLMTLKENNGECFIELENTSDAYTNWTGTVTKTTANNIIFDLNGNGKKKYIMLSVEHSGKKNLYTGIFLKHDANSKIYACNFLIQRIPKNLKNLRAEVINLEQLRSKANLNQELSINEGEVLAQLFKNKSHTCLKNKKIYAFERMNKWLNRKEIERKEAMVYDLFIAAPYRSVKKQFEKSEDIIKIIKTQLENFMVGDKNLSEMEGYEQLQNKLKEAIQKEVFNLSVKKKNENKLNKASEQQAQYQVKKIHDLIGRLKNQFNTKSYYAYSKGQKDKNRKRYPKDVLKQEYTALQKSRAFMLICTQKELWTSCWTIVGWAMEMKRDGLQMPIFIFYEHEEGGIPYVLKAAHTWEYIELFLFSHQIRSSNMVDDIVDTLKSSQLWLEQVEKSPNKKTD